MSLFRRISNLFWRSRMDREIRSRSTRSKIEREIADELPSHIQMRTADNIAAGMTPEEARRAALVRFGNPAVIGERIVAVDSGLGVEKMLRDLRYAVRQFQRNPGFALTVIGTIALGIGATVGVFSVVHSVWLQPLPYRNPDRLIVAYGDMRKRDTAELPFSSPDFMGHSFATRWAIRTSSDPAKYESLVRSHIAQLGGQIALTEVQPMESLVAQAQATTRLALLLIGVFALAAALLSTLGIYGVLSTSVRQRTSEIGVRMALGATRGGILSLIVGQGLRLGVIGIVLGCGVTLGLTRWIASLLVETRPTDPLTFTGITVAFFVIVAMASWLPARRAASLDPIRALRSE